MQWYWRELLRQLNGLELEEARKRERWAREDAAETAAGRHDTDDEVGYDGGRVQPSPDYTNPAVPDHDQQLGKRANVAVLRSELDALDVSLAEHTANLRAVRAAAAANGGADGGSNGASPVTSSATTTRPGTTPSVLKVTPPCELAFKPVAGDKTRSSATIQLENPTSDTVWFKVKLTSPSRYTIDPHMGKISGHAKKVVKGAASRPHPKPTAMFVRNCAWSVSSRTGTSLHWLFGSHRQRVLRQPGPGHARGAILVHVVSGVDSGCDCLMTIDKPACFFPPFFPLFPPFFPHCLVPVVSPSCWRVPALPSRVGLDSAVMWRPTLSKKDKTKKDKFMIMSVLDKNVAYTGRDDGQMWRSVSKSHMMEDVLVGIVDFGPPGGRSGAVHDSSMHGPARTPKRGAETALVAADLAACPATLALLERGAALQEQHDAISARTSSFGKFSFILANLSWVCGVIRRRRVLPSPVCA